MESQNLAGEASAGRALPAHATKVSAAATQNLKVVLSPIACSPKIEASAQAQDVRLCGILSKQPAKGCFFSQNIAVVRRSGALRRRLQGDKILAETLSKS
jgi:hypothetical protein